MTLLTVLLLTLAGVPLCRVLDREAHGIRMIGEAFLFGAGTAASLLYLMPLVHVAWNRTSLLLAMTALGAVCMYLRRGTPPSPSIEQRATGSRLWFLLDIATITLVVAHAVFASTGRSYEWDYVSIWGFKAAYLFDAHTIPWSVMRDPQIWIQSGHPIFAPLLFDVNALISGRWADQNLGLLFTAFGCATIMLIRGLVREETGSRMRRAVTTLAVTPGALSLWIGLAEGMLIGFATCGILLVRRGLARQHRPSLTAGAILLGFAAMTKDEGTAFIIAAVAGILVACNRPLVSSSVRRFRNAAQMWPAIVILLPWIITRKILGIETDFLAGDVSARKEHLLAPVRILRELFVTPVSDHLFWWAAIALFVIAWRQAWTAERFLLVVLSLQLVADVTQNFLVPWDPAPHIRYSWNRIIDQMAALTAFLAVTVASREWSGETLDEKTPQSALTSST